MLFSGKENVFICFVAFQKMFRKIFFDVWLCSWKYHGKHIFYLLLTFSHIFSVAKQIYNIIHSSIQKYKQNPEKKIIKSGHIFSVAKQIYNIIHSSTQKHKQNPGKKKSSNPVKLREEWRERGNWVRRGAAISAKARSRSAQCFARSWSMQRRDRDRWRDLSPFVRLWVILSLSLSPFAWLWAPLFARLSSRSDLKVK